MPVFHTKTIESILEPVAQQVSRLVILHEDAEDGSAMPDLEKPVQAVSKAVANLIKVGRETINSSDDQILRQDMPVSLQRVERASKLLEEASAMFKADPFSIPARKKLIEGARGILQGTSSLLLCFDESEVRKIIKTCKEVLNYLAVAEVIETMEDLVHFVKDISPHLSKVSRDVDDREKELTHMAHREILCRSLDSVKTLAPILICAMKIYVQLLAQGKKTDEAAENRNYLASRMTDEINQIIRVLQLTTYDEDEWDADNLTCMKKALIAIDGKVQAAHDWLEDPTVLPGGIGEKSLRHILEYANRIADRSLPPDRDAIRKATGDINAMVNALCELRSDGKGDSPQAQSLSRSIGQKLKDLIGLCNRAIANVERSGMKQPAHTLKGKVDQAQAYLANPAADDKGHGASVIQSIVDEARRLAAQASPAHRQDILNLCDEVEALNRQLADLVRRGQGNTPQAQELARLLSKKLDELQKQCERALVNRVVDDFVDIHTPLKQFTEATLAPEGTPNRQENFNDKAKNLDNFSKRASQTARNVASGSAPNKRLAENLLSSANQVESLCPQLVKAGRIRLNHPDNKAADEHFENLRKQYEDSIQNMRNMVDQAIDPVAFIKATEDAIRKHTALCENAINNGQPQPMVDNASQIARLANRVLMLAKNEAENSEDPDFINRMNRAAANLQAAVPPMVQNAKGVALNINDPMSCSTWRDSNKALLDAVINVRKAISPYDPPTDLSQLKLNDGLTRAVAPPRPPLPIHEEAPPRPPPPETDDEFEERFPMIKGDPNDTIMMAAHGLHQEVKQWSSKDNEIIAAAKRMALLMARLSQLVRGEGGTKKDLIACAKAIAEASTEVTRLAKEQAKLCTDKRMRTNILQECERIPTLGTQLKILSTVKATMLGAQATEEDQEAMNMLEGNAQNLMQSVKETVRSCEAASIKIRTDAGVRCVWERKSPWYQY
ncbi:vinculin [Brevipalpus obovatus]|uniref:vinculin n=1 Tax=Brevipalpus obovatus TaxID=246614 RepID=UPI003D9EB4C1